MVYSTRRFVVCLSVCHFVLVAFSPFSIANTSLGEKRANLSAFQYVCLVCACLDFSVSSSSWGLGRAAVCDCGTPWTFLLPFFPTLYWLPKLHKRPYKARLIANSSSCTTNVLSKLLTPCLTAVKKHWIRYYDTVYERDGMNHFWSIKNCNDVLNKFKSKNFQASKLSTYDFSALYTTLPHHLIKDKFIDLINRTFIREYTQ